MRCSSCGTELPAQATYCPTCGAVTPYQVSDSGVSPYDLTAVSSPSATPQFKPATDYGFPPYGLSSQNPYEVPLLPPPPPRPHSHIKFGFLIGLLSGILVAVLILATVGFFGLLKQGPKNPSVGNTSRPTASPIPSLTSTPLPKPGTVLYQADWSRGLNGWVGTSDWKVLNGMLLNDGSGNPSAAAGPTIVAPYQGEATSDYAVEVRIQEVRGNSCFDPVTIRGSQGTNGWQGYKITVCGGTLRISSDDYYDVIAITPFVPGNSWHLYRVEAKGTQIRVFLDGGLVLKGNDNRYLSARQVGLKSSAQLIVSSFKIIAL